MTIPSFFEQTHPMPGEGPHAQEITFTEFLEAVRENPDAHVFTSVDGYLFIQTQAPQELEPAPNYEQMLHQMLEGVFDMGHMGQDDFDGCRAYLNGEG